jgi:hypothetical protein
MRPPRYRRTVGSEPERIELLGFQVIFLHSEPDSGAALLEWEAPPNAGGIPVHVHDETDEGF